MKEERTNRTGSILTTVLVGGALGAGIALVLAPKSGSETRKDLKRAANRLSHAVDIGKDLYGESKEFVGKAVEASKKAYMEEKPLEIRINRGRALIVPILASGIIGAGIGLLLAPKSGNETRKDLRRAADRVSHAVDIGKDLYGEGKEFIGKAVEASKKAYREEKPLELRSSMGRPIMVSILASGIIGAGIGLLLAPKTGRETRADLKHFASDARVKVVSAIDKGKDLYVTGKDAITGAVEAGKKAYVEAKEKVAHAA